MSLFNPAINYLHRRSSRPIVSDRTVSDSISSWMVSSAWTQQISLHVKKLVCKHPKDVNSCYRIWAEIFSTGSIVPFDHKPLPDLRQQNDQSSWNCTWKRDNQLGYELKMSLHEARYAYAWSRPLLRCSSQLADSGRLVLIRRTIRCFIKSQEVHALNPRVPCVFCYSASRLSIGQSKCCP